MGTSNRKAAEKFIARHGLEKSSALFHTLYKGKNWYVVVTGDHRDRATAMKAIEKLPAAIKRQKPWARSFASVQSGIREGKN